MRILSHFEPDDIFDNPFHAIALFAYVDVAREQGGWPDSKTVKNRAYGEYEKWLLEKKS
jgi:hypothetical protein